MFITLLGWAKAERSVGTGISTGPLFFFSFKIFEYLYSSSETKSELFSSSRTRHSVLPASWHDVVLTCMYSAQCYFGYSLMSGRDIACHVYCRLRHHLRADRASVTTYDW